MKHCNSQKIVRVLAGVSLAALMLASVHTDVRAESTGTVAVNSAIVRSDASTTADSVATAASGTSVTISEQKTDSSGNVWYKVTLSDGATGYIRSDLLNVTEAPAETTSTETTETSDASTDEVVAIDAGNPNVVNGIDVSAIMVPDGVTGQDLQQATINVATGKIRSDASTNDEIVAQVSEGTNLVIAGSKLGSDSKTWYYIAFINNGSQQYGYVRSDLVNMGDVIVIQAPVEEAPVEEAPTEEPVAVNNDYELVYTDDGTGNNVWYLYNHIDNTREKLQELLDFADSQTKKQAENAATIQKQKIVIIVLAALLFVAIVVMVVLIIRGRSGGYVEYEDEDEEDEDEDDDEEEEEESYGRRKNRFSRRSRRYEEEEDDDEEEVEEERPVRRSRSAEEPVRRRSDSAPRRPVTYEEEPSVKTAPKKTTKSKNFMIDDDDFEFEFLNMDDE